MDNHVGFNGGLNRVHRVGNIPDAQGLMTPAGELQNRNAASTTRTAIEASVGVTQVIDRQSDAIFYRHSLLASEALPDLASAVGLQTTQDIFPRLHVLLAKLTDGTRW